MKVQNHKLLNGLNLLTTKDKKKKYIEFKEDEGYYILKTTLNSRNDIVSKFFGIKTFGFLLRSFRFRGFEVSLEDDFTKVSSKPMNRPRPHVQQPQLSHILKKCLNYLIPCDLCRASINELSVFDLAAIDIDKILNENYNHITMLANDIDVKSLQRQTASLVALDNIWKERLNKITTEHEQRLGQIEPISP